MASACAPRALAPASPWASSSHPSRRRARVVSRASDPNQSLPQALLETVARKFRDDVDSFVGSLVEEPPRYARPPTLPIAGNMVDINQGGHEQLLEWALAYGSGAEGVHEVKMLSKPILHVCDAAVARDLMFDKSSTFPDRGVSAIAKFFREDQAAFVNTSGQQWMAYRKMGTASVNGSALDRLAGKVAERSEALAERWSRSLDARGGLDVEVDTATQAVTLEVIHEALFSERLDVIDEEPAAVAIARSFREFNVANQDLLNDYLQLYQKFDTPEALRRETHRRKLRAHFDERADAREALIAETGDAKDAPQDLLTALLTATDPETGEKLTRDDVNLTLTEMMVAGHDTTAATVACMLTLLAANPSAMREVVAEVDAAAEALGGRLPSTVAEVAELLPKLDDAMKEAMRLYPAVLIVVREADEKGGTLLETSAAPILVPPGAGMWISPYVMGRLPRYWGGSADAKRYRPSRFEEARERGDALDAFMPFGGGPRVCLGSRFAMLEGKVTAAAILRDFDLALTPELKSAIDKNGGELPISYAAGLMSFPEPLRLRAQRR